MSGKPSASPVVTTAPPGSSSARSSSVRRAVREIVFVAVLFLAYKLGRLLVEGHVGDALTNAQNVWDFERLVHLPSEASLQATVLAHTFWIHVANSFYAYVHFPATAAALVWLYVKRPEIYLWFRRTLASVTALSLVIHALFPLAPPRMLTTAGMVDTGHIYGPSVYGSPSTDTLSNQYAAMPSLHVGWALAVAIALIAATRSRWRWLWLAHPVATLLVVVVTGNHYWLDAIAAVALLALVLAVVTPLSRQSLTARPALRPRPNPVPTPRRPVPLAGQTIASIRPAVSLAGQTISPEPTASARSAPGDPTPASRGASLPAVPSAPVPREAVPPAGVPPAAVPPVAVPPAGVSPVAVPPAAAPRPAVQRPAIPRQRGSERNQPFHSPIPELLDVERNQPFRSGRRDGEAADRKGASAGREAASARREGGVAGGVSRSGGVDPIVGWNLVAVGRAVDGRSAGGGAEHRRGR
ncbi:phosphatase PAP2 family protein [Paractinoplanes globisporus]|uniref:Phosphatase PAP2 family protein n=1 Tax=Paractinoplanes globisporus TaxID=113565 RepID=A0ABW6WWK0_9ACTN|nr:phosphatase PAP2 family protein [Actinoplanes globisporus]